MDFLFNVGDTVRRKHIPSVEWVIVRRWMDVTGPRYIVRNLHHPYNEVNVSELELTA